MSIKVEGDRCEWNNNLKAIKEDFLGEMTRKFQGTFDKDVLMIAGNHSKYVNRKRLSKYREVFPKLKDEDLVMLDSGHMIHVERLEEVRELIEERVRRE